MKYIAKNQKTLIQQDIFWLEKLEPLALNHEESDMEEDTSDDEQMNSKDDVPKEVGSEDELEGDDNNEE